MKGFDHFALFAPFYDRVFEFMEPTRLRALLRLPADGWLLDAGGGTGRVADALCGQADNIVVVDLSAAMLRETRQKACLAAARSHVERLPFPDAAFDRILVVDAFHHFCDQEEAAADLMRVLKPGGRLVIEEPNIELWSVKLVALAERLALMRSRFFSPADMRQMFEMLGGRAAVELDDGTTAWIVVDK